MGPTGLAWEMSPLRLRTWRPPCTLAQLLWLPTSYSTSWYYSSIATGRPGGGGESASIIHRASGAARRGASRLRRLCVP